MPRYRLSPQAEQEIEAILRWTQHEFGAKARRRYKALLIRAIMDLAEDPHRPGSHDRPEIAEAARTYHVRHSRDRVGDESWTSCSDMRNDDQTSDGRVTREPRDTVEVAVIASKVRETIGLHQGDDQGVAHEQFVLLAHMGRGLDMRRSHRKDLETK